MAPWPFGSRQTSVTASAQAEATQRQAQWEQALAQNALPPFVRDRLTSAAEGRTPWLSTMTPAELLLARSHGVRPVATVSGTCWYHYGYSWTNGHAEGWHVALARLGEEAVAAGANAVVDVKLRTIHLQAGPSMDYTVLGTAVRIDGLPPTQHPVIATVPALEFVRLLEADIVVTGVAIGAHYEWLTGYMKTTIGMRANQPLANLTAFWQQVRQQAFRQLKSDAARLGTGVLAHTHFSQLLKQDGGENQPSMVLGRHITIGTVVDCPTGAGIPHGITPVVDMRDDLSPLNDTAPHGHTAYGAQRDQEGSI